MRDPGGGSCSSSKTRCECGNLLSIQSAGGIEIKCRRCKTPVTISWMDGGQFPIEVRCQCGSLLAKRKGGELELKCRRCKRCVVVKKNAETTVTLMFTVAGTWEQRQWLEEMYHVLCC